VAVTFRQLQCFLGIAEVGNFTRAAERLSMKQPVLSQQILDLEAELGIRLFDRTTRRVELTEGGREFRLAAIRILDELAHATRNAREFAERKRGRVKVAAPPLLAAVILPPAIAQFRTAYPSVAVGLIEARAGEIANLVRTGQVDCGLGTFSTTEDGIDERPIAVDALMAFCRDDSFFRDRDVLRWSDLVDTPVITLTQESSLRTLVEQGFHNAGVVFTPAYEFNNITTALSCVEAGLGVAILPTYAATAIHSTCILRRPLIDPIVSRSIVLITATERTETPANLAFGRYLTEYTRSLLPSA